MKHRAARRFVFPLFFLSCIFVSCTSFSQVMSIPSSGFGNIGTAGISGSPIGLGLIDSMAMTNNLFTMTTNAQNNSNQSPSASVSKLDLKAPWKARREYEKGYQLLMRKDFQNAVLHLTSAASMYPSFVAAHNALGSAYLNLGQNDRARDQFAQLSFESGMRGTCSGALFRGGRVHAEGFRDRASRSSITDGSGLRGVHES
jgi:TolA-binding protein